MVLNINNSEELFFSRRIIKDYSFSVLYNQVTKGEIMSCTKKLILVSISIQYYQGIHSLSCSFLLPLYEKSGLIPDTETKCLTNQ